MNPREQNLKLAKDIVAKIKRDVKTSNDILSRAKTKLKDKQREEALRKEYGATFDGLISHLQKVNILTLALTFLAKQHANYSRLSASLALVKYGVGEDSDVAVYAAFELIKAGKAANTAVVTLAEEQTKMNSEGFLSHTIVVQGAPSTFKDISALNTLTDECIVIDPFLNVACQANQYLKHEKVKEFMQVYHYNKVLSYLPCDKESVEAIAYQSDRLFKDINKFIPSLDAKLDVIHQQAIACVNAENTKRKEIATMLEAAVKAKEVVKTKEAVKTKASPNPAAMFSGTWGQLLARRQTANVDNKPTPPKL